MEMKVEQARKELFPSPQHFSLIKNSQNRTVLVDFHFKSPPQDNTSSPPIAPSSPSVQQDCLPDTANYKPSFLHDGFYFTPSFVLGVDKKEYAANVGLVLQKFQNRKQEDFQEKQQLFIPKPVSKTRFCNVCKSTYEDYLEHTDSCSHKISMKKAKFSKEIAHLCKMYSKRQVERMTRSNKRGKNSAKRACHQVKDEDKLLLTVSTVEEEALPSEPSMLLMPGPLIES